jgi:hypothetical protein
VPASRKAAGCDGESTLAKPSPSKAVIVVLATCIQQGAQRCACVARSNHNKNT